RSSASTAGLEGGGWLASLLSDMNQTPSACRVFLCVVGCKTTESATGSGTKDRKLPYARDGDGRVSIFKERTGAMVRGWPLADHPRGILSPFPVQSVSTTTFGPLI